MNPRYPLLAGVVLVGVAQAAVTVSDNGLTAPTLNPATDTGHLANIGGADERFGWDTETLIQTFTLPAAGTLQFIHLAYNGFDNTDTLTITLQINGGTDYQQTGIVLDGSNFSGNAGSDNNSGPRYWIQFDLSGENIDLAAGQHSFTMAATANTGNTVGLWPRTISGVATATPGAP